MRGAVSGGAHDHTNTGSAILISGEAYFKGGRARPGLSM